MPDISITISRPADVPPEAFIGAMEEAFQMLVDGTPVDTGTCQAAWVSDISDEEATFYNPTEYASYLDEGISDQAPNGIIDPVLAEIPDLFNEYINRLF